MFILVQRASRPDATYWPGRRLLGAVDAVVWPLAWVVLVYQYEQAAGLVVPVTVVATLCAFFRLCGAVFNNHRYWFTSWWVAKFFALLCFVGLVTKLALWAAGVQ